MCYLAISSLAVNEQQSTLKRDSLARTKQTAFHSISVHHKPKWVHFNLKFKKQTPCMLQHHVYLMYKDQLLKLSVKA